MLILLFLGFASCWVLFLGWFVVFYDYELDPKVIEDKEKQRRRLAGG